MSVFKENIKSLRMYFIVVGVILGLQFSIGGEHGASRLLSPLGMPFSFVFLYMGIELKKLIENSPGVILIVLLLNLVWQIQQVIGGISNGMQVLTVFQIAIPVLVTLYLFFNVRRLSLEG